MTRHALLSSALAVPLFLGACAGTTATSVETEMQAVLTDVNVALPIVEALPGVSTFAPVLAGIGLADNGLSAILAVVKAGTGTPEQTAIASAITAVQQIQAALPQNATIQADAPKALAALQVLSTVSTQSAQVQAFTLLGQIATAALASIQPASARYGAVSPVSSLTNDANGHLHNLGG